MENFKIVVDPTGHFKGMGAKEQRLIMATGFLPAFACGSADTIAENMENNYEFHSGWNPGGASGLTVTAEGHYIYPGDPVMYPLMQISAENEIIYIYQYGIVVQMLNGALEKWTRMD